MTVTRRSFTLGSMALGAALAPSLLAARQAMPNTLLAEEPLPPETILEFLLASTVSSPFFPSDLPELSIVSHFDPDDNDFENAVGGALVTLAPDEKEVIGGYIVLETDADAMKRVDDDLPSDMERITLLDFPGVWQRYVSGTDLISSYGLFGVVIGNVTITAIGQGGVPIQNDLRALSVMTGLIDHYLRTVTPTDTDL